MSLSPYYIMAQARKTLRRGMKASEENPTPGAYLNQVETPAEQAIKGARQM